MGNTIRLNNKQPAEEWLIMSNTGTDIFLELIINAASTEETNASMEELNATFSIITESASKLQVLAENMTETISYFKT